MKINIEAWINDEAEEHLMNLVAQEYYSEAWEFIEKITHMFHNGLYLIAGRTLSLTIQNSNNYKEENKNGRNIKNRDFA